MKRLGFVFFLFFFFQISFGQVLTKDEAYVFADQLFEVEILSDRGRKMLRMLIDKKNIDTHEQINSYEVTFHDSQKLTKSYVLDFCSKAFNSEFLYRLGFDEQQKLNKEKYQKDGKQLPLDFEQITSDFLKNQHSFEGYEIERVIKGLDPMETGFDYFSSSRLHQVTLYHDGKQEKELIHKNRSVVGKNRFKTAHDLFHLELISETVLQEVLEKLGSFEIKLESEVLEYVLFQTSFYEKLPSLKRKERKLLDDLQKAEFLSIKTVDELSYTTDYKDILSRFEIFKKGENALSFEMEDKSTDRMAQYQEVLEKINTRFFNLDYQDFSFELFEEEDYVFKELIKVTSRNTCKINGRIYKTFNYEGLVNTKYKPNWNLDSVRLGYERNIVNLFNKWLADQNSPSRLYLVFKNNQDSKIEIAIALMTEKQFDAWEDPYGQILGLWKENHDSKFNSEGINQIISDFQLINLLSHLGKEEIEKGKNKVQENSISSYVDILLCFSDVVVDFDRELGNMKNPYEELTNKFAKASKGNFQPKDIVDNFKIALGKNEKTVFFSFNILGKKYERDLKLMGDWLDPRFLNLINNAIQDLQIDGRFYDCINDEQYDGYIFLTNRQYEFIKKEYPQILNPTNND